MFVEECVLGSLWGDDKVRMMMILVSLENEEGSLEIVMAWLTTGGAGTLQRISTRTVTEIKRGVSKVHPVGLTVQSTDVK